MNATDSFKQLIARSRDGDEQAIEALVEQYEPAIRRIARRALGTSLRPYLDSLDLTQSVHAAIFDGLHTGKLDFSVPQQLVAFAATMIRNRTIDRWRHHRRQDRPSHAPYDESSDELLERLTALRSISESPADEVAAKDFSEQLLASLDEIDRRLLELKLDGHSTKDASEILGVEAGMLRVRLMRLRKRLRDSKFLSDWV